MDVKTQNYLSSLIEAKISNPALGNFIITGINKDGLIIKREGEESSFKMNLIYIKTNSNTTCEIPEPEKSLIAILEQETGLSYSDVKKNYKTRKIDYKEFRFFHLMFRNKVMGYSLDLAGKEYKKDHATVLHANKTLESWHETDKSFREKYKNAIEYILDLNEDAFKER